MSADEKPRWRQLSWVTYGNAYLNGYAPFASWHGLESFEDTAAEFRLIDGTLIAEDGFEWLWWLRQSGVQRLSIECWTELREAGRFSKPDSLVIVSHHLDRDDIWVRVYESSAADVLARELGSYEICFGRSFRIADRYVHVASRRKSFESPRTDWKRIDDEVRRSFSQFKEMQSLMNGPDLSRAEWFGATWDSGKQLPILPPTRSLWIVHKILFRICSIRGRLDSATHPKNESSIYYWPSPEVQNQLDDLSRTIEQQLERVLCLAGSETGWRLSEHPVPSPGDVSGGGSGAAVNLGASGNTMSVGVGALLALTVTLTLLMIAAWHFPKTASLLGLILILHRSFKR